MFYTEFKRGIKEMDFAVMDEFWLKDTRFMVITNDIFSSQTDMTADQIITKAKNNEFKLREKFWCNGIQFKVTTKR